MLFHTNLQNATYYTVSDFQIVARCWCNGHASMCEIDPSTGQHQCLCEDNTCGRNCDQCCPLYNNREYQRDVLMPSSCEECNCHNQSSSCLYSAVVDRTNMSLNTYGEFSGGGICQDCQSFTEGINCQFCKTFYYLPDGVDVASPSPCLPCDCDQRGTQNTSVLINAFGDCVKETGGGFSSGDCICKMNVEGTMKKYLCRLQYLQSYVCSAWILINCHNQTPSYLVVGQLQNGIYITILSCGCGMCQVCTCNASCATALPIFLSCLHVSSSSMTHCSVMFSDVPSSLVVLPGMHIQVCVWLFDRSSYSACLRMSCVWELHIGHLVIQLGI